MAEPMDPGGSPTTTTKTGTTTTKTPTQTAAQAAAASRAKAAAAAKAKADAAAAAKAKAAADAKAKADAASRQAETAASFGWSISFFKSIPELNTLLNKATAEEWSPARFTAALQGTTWFRTTSESQRKYATLKSTDPASFKQQIDEGYNKVMLLAGQMGAPMTQARAYNIADTALKLGWSQDHLTRFLSTQVAPDGKGNFTHGQAAAYQSQFRQLASDYGIPVSDGLMNAWVRDATQGVQTAESIKNVIQNSAASKYVALAERIKGGESVRQIADPYIQTYGKLLEVNADNVSLNDPLIQRALQAKDAKGRPTTQTVYDFENTLRNDPRWAKTDNAQQQMSATANSILKSFGLAG
jgi:hypothetical protein